MDNQLLLTGTLNILLAAVFIATSITYKSMMLFIKRRNSLVKQFKLKGIQLKGMIL